MGNGKDKQQKEGNRLNLAHFTYWLSKLALPVIFLFVGIALGRFVLLPRNNRSIRIQKLHPPHSSFKFINPLIGFDIAGKKEFQEFQPMRKDLEDFISQQIASKNADKISVYYRDIENGHWTGINENDGYDPASLLKVPIMMAYFKKADSDPAILLQQVYFEEDKLNPEQTILVKQHTYTIDQLIAYMIINSDNEAKNVLLANIDLNYLVEVFSDLGISVPSTASQTYYISAKSYSLFFRTLYNATFLSREMSEKALNLLNQTGFKDGLVAGVPKDITIAHKFGEHATYEDGKFENEELHDCGIIYYSAQSPYFLCVMTKGKDPNLLAKIIQGVSQLVYTSVNNLQK